MNSITNTFIIIGSNEIEYESSLSEKICYYVIKLLKKFKRLIIFFDIFLRINISVHFYIRSESFQKIRPKNSHERCKSTNACSFKTTIRST